MIWGVFLFVLKKRYLLPIIACLTLLLAVPSLLATPTTLAANTTNWGLGFGTAGEPPTGNASSEYLAKFNAHYLGNTAEKVIYLTFDAGYENGYTAPILDALKKHNVPATFFLVGNYLNTAPELVKRMVNEGHTVGNHTATHPDMSRITTREAFANELQSLESQYRELTGQEMLKLYRPPQGKFSEQNLKLAQEMGYHTFFWSLAYVDWYVDNQPTKAEAMKKLTTRIHNGAIVLLHSTSATNAAILDDLIAAWKQQGYTFKPLYSLAPSLVPPHTV